MARGTALSDLLDMLKAELGADMDSTVAPGGDDVMKLALANQQKWLVNTFDWPFMKKTVDVALTADSRYVAVPDLNFDRPVQIKIKQNSIWLVDPVTFGIDESHYMVRDSENNVKSDPVLRWDWDNSTDDLRIEVWPVPASAQTLRFVGQKNVADLVADDDVADLDDLLLVYFTAAEFLAKAKQGDAQAKLAKAQARMNQLRGSSPSKMDRFVLGGGYCGRRHHKRPTIGVSIDPIITMDNDSVTMDSN